MRECVKEQELTKKKNEFDLKILKKKKEGDLAEEKKT